MGNKTSKRYNYHAGTEPVDIESSPKPTIDDNNEERNDDVNVELRNDEKTSLIKKNERVYIALDVTKSGKFTIIDEEHYPKDDPEDDNNVIGYCYFLQKHSDLNTQIYKIGRTGGLFKRLGSKEYKDCVVYVGRRVSDQRNCERALLKRFRKEYEQPPGTDRERFVLDNVSEAITLFNSICDEYALNH